MKVKYSAQTDTGRRRTANEDSILAYVPNEGKLYLFAVADGVGSLADGAEASKLTTMTLADAFRSFRGSDPGPQLVTSIRRANTLVYSRGRGSNAAKMMGSTLVALVLTPGRFTVAHVGDSRAYLLREGTLHRLTEDHSLVAEQVRAGILTEAEASESQHRHIITRSLGVGTEVEVDQRGPEPLRPGDIFLLSSDGLHDMVTDAEIEAFIPSREPDQAATELIELANARGGPDNISVVIVHIEEPNDHE